MAKKSSGSKLPPGIPVEEKQSHHTQIEEVEKDETEKTVVVEDDKSAAGVTSVQMPVFVMQGYSKKRIDFTLTGREASAAKALRDGAEITESQLPNGKYISTPADAIKLFLNRIADEIGL